MDESKWNEVRGRQAEKGAKKEAERGPFNPETAGDQLEEFLEECVDGYYYGGAEVLRFRAVLDRIAKGGLVGRFSEEEWSHILDRHRAICGKMVGLQELARVLFGRGEAVQQERDELMVFIERRIK